MCAIPRPFLRKSVPYIRMPQLGFLAETSGPRASVLVAIGSPRLVDMGIWPKHRPIGAHLRIATKVSWPLHVLLIMQRIGQVV